MEGGETATVTRADPPVWWEPPPDKPAKDNLYCRRALGGVEHVGNVVMDVSFGGQTVTTTPNHLWFSASRNCYVPAEELRVGEMLQPPDADKRLRCEAVSPPRYGLVKLYNIEVEQFHNYFVGASDAAALVHNGIPGAAGCGVPMPASVTKAEAEMIAAGRMNVRSAKQFGIVAPPDHHLYPQANRDWFEARGVNVDDFTVTLDRAVHEAIHFGGGPGKGGGWWNDTIMNNLLRREQNAGRMLTPSEIFEEGQMLLQRARLDHHPIHPWNSTK